MYLRAYFVYERGLVSCLTVYMELGQAPLYLCKLPFRNR